MYHITLYEGGRFCTHVGGEIGTLPEAIEQLKATAKTIDATELPDIYGYKFDRNGTTCGLIITDRFRMPISTKPQTD